MIPIRCLSLLTLLAFAPASLAGIKYVDAALTTGANNGSSWADAYQGTIGLQSALGSAVVGDQIWVRQGLYKPTAGATRSIYFEMKTGVEIYGGFNGTETLLTQRDFLANPTILSGDLAGNDASNIFTDNSFHVINCNTANATAVLDGFTVTGGNANGASASNQDKGGGILCLTGSAVNVRNCRFVANRCTFGGGAGYINGATPSFTDTRFENNIGGSFGGAFDMNNGTTNFVRCEFIGNSAARAGAVECFGNSNSKFTNCIFRGNTATGSGGGGAVWVSNSSPVLRNCTITGNTSTINNTAGILASPVITIANCIVVNNSGPGGAQNLINNVSGVNATYSCIQGGLVGVGNLNTDPLFVNGAGGDLRLSPLSPCTDAGSNAQIPTGTTTDFAGLPRLADNPAVVDTGAGTAPVVDMGAHELPNTLYTAFCFGDGSLATPCPCGNTGSTGRGCLNSDLFSPGALLSVSGTANPDTVVLTASDMLATVPCVFLQGTSNVSAGAVFGDGVRCVGGSLKRLYIKVASGGIAAAPGVGDPSISARSATLGDVIPAGAQRFYQVYYRDSDAFFCPAPTGSTFNITSGLILHW
jgi:parallel beta-helix repeat protein